MFELVLNCLCRSLLLDIIFALPSHGHPLVAPLAILGLKEQLVPALAAHKFTALCKTILVQGKKVYFFFFFQAVFYPSDQAGCFSCQSKALPDSSSVSWCSCFIERFLCFARFCRVLTSDPLNSPSSSPTLLTATSLQFSPLFYRCYCFLSLSFRMRWVYRGCWLS